jgi:hypothetical protein
MFILYHIILCLKSNAFLNKRALMTWGGLSHQGLLILGPPLKISIKGEIFSYGKLVDQHLYYN